MQKKYFEKATQILPTSYIPHYKLGKMYFNYYLLNGEVNYRLLASKQFKKVIAKSKNLSSKVEYNNYAESNYYLGLIELERDNLTTALHYFIEAEKYYTQNYFFFSALPPSWKDLINYYIGVCYEQLKNKEKALENYWKALESHPLHLGVHIQIGMVYYNSGEVKKALNEWKMPGITLEEWEKQGRQIKEYELFANKKQKYSKYEVAYLYYLICKASIELSKLENEKIPKILLNYAEQSVNLTERKHPIFLKLLGEVSHLLNINPND